MKPDAPSLVLPFALVGLVGGWAVADAFATSWSEDPRWLLALVTPCACALLGLFLTHRARRVGRYSWVALVGGTLVAGSLNGAAIGLLLGGLSSAGANALPGAIVGVPFGFFCSLPFVPALSLVQWAARRASDARARTMVRASADGGVWTATAAAIAIGAPVGVWIGSSASRYHAPLANVAAVAVACALGAVVILFVRDARTLSSLRAHARSLGTTRPRDAGPEIAALPVVDFGVGEEDRVEIAPAHAAYRAMDRPLRRVVGNLRRALGLVDAQMSLDLVAIAIAAVGLSATFACGVEWSCPAGPG